MSFITSLGVAVPPNCFHQDTIASFMQKAMQLDYENERKLKTIFRSSGINTRYSVLNDYGKQSGFDFYSNSTDFEPFPSTERRLGQYRNSALPLALEAVRKCLEGNPGVSAESFTHLIVVSCTGMYAPGLDIELVKELSLREDVNRTCIAFMGCYAAFNAIKAADSFCKAQHDAIVLIVCVELCTIHFQKEASEDNLLANALFGDGAAAMIMQRMPQPGWNLSPEIFHNALAYNGREHMAWNIGNMGFEMKLSSYVPDVIQKGIKKLTDSLLDRVDKKIEEMSRFAIHPGGKKILEVIEHELGITKEQNEPAYATLSRFGNMSSSTIVFVLDHILRKLTKDDQDKHMLSFAFGPGLTLESMLLKIHHV
ncbi:MAG: type III polyketide synthase [Cyclobacteriaceae bacterium]|nr:type III polyketide synthase [Cyclobacteriaceae bacterium]